MILEKPSKNRAWAEVSLGAIEHNYKLICKASQSPALCVIKADAYGHGADKVGQRLQDLGAPYFAVAEIQEAISLRESGIVKPILILGYVDEADLEYAIKYKLTLAVYNTHTAKLISQAAVKTGKTAAVHYKLDTGMSRLGFPAWEREKTVLEILECAAFPGIVSEGIFTHFSSADVPEGKEYTCMQYERFAGVCGDLRHAGLDLPLRHCANSAGIQHYGDFHCTMTRAGIILYGCRPDISVPYQMELRPAMTLKARVAQVRILPAGTSVSYGRTFKTDKPTPVAVIAMGYADGFLRNGSGRAHVLINGVSAPVLGRICMDMCMAEIPETTDVRQGDEVIIFGPHGITAEDVAKAANTISYEVLCAVSKRVPRFYID